MTPAGIEPATFRFVAQHLNHCATAVSKFIKNKIVLFAIYIDWRGNKQLNKKQFICQFCYSGIVLAEGLEIRLRKLMVLRNTM